MLELDDIQALVFSAHGHMPYSRYLFLRITDKKLAQHWIKDAAPQIVRGTRREHGAPKPSATAHIAFTYQGLSGLGLPADTLAAFPREFTEGMSMGERPRVLGDTGDSAPETWEFGGPKNAPIDILLAIYAESQLRMEEIKTSPWYPSNPNQGIEIVFDQESFRASDNEPFGFRDGISQPVIQGGPIPADPSQRSLTPGEFVLGYPNEYSNLSPAPTVPAATDAGGTLKSDPEDPTRRAFALNGTFIVLRKLKQDVDGFWKWCEATTTTAGSPPDPEAKIALAAKLVGRWPSGCPLSLSPQKDNPAIGADSKRNNSFNFADTDLQGYACPIGSHIRRSNPRDVLHPNNPERSAEISNRHRIMRRGRPYSAQVASGEVETGLIFVAINADLQRQFEFVQQTWLNNGKFNGLFDDQDPIVSNSDSPGNFTIQREPIRKVIHGVPRFVTVRGGAYFFMPGLKALQYLSNLS